MLDFGLAGEHEIRAELGLRLQRQRLSLGLSQVELAERAGISASTVKLIEAHGRCTLENFVRMVMALGLADQLQPLFALQIRSIEQMEQAEKIAAGRLAVQVPQAPSARHEKNCGLFLWLGASAGNWARWRTMATICCPNTLRRQSQKTSSSRRGI